MEKAYLGESYEQEFRIRNKKDSTVVASSATFKIVVNGQIKQSGALAQKPDGVTWSFRFIASTAGLNEIIIEYRMGDDTWIEKFWVDVVA